MSTSGAVADATIDQPTERTLTVDDVVDLPDELAAYSVTRQSSPARIACSLRRGTIMPWAQIDRVGQRFGYRERAHTLGELLRPVEVLKLGPPRSGKVRVRWVDGDYAGLDE